MSDRIVASWVANWRPVRDWPAGASDGLLAATGFIVAVAALAVADELASRDAAIALAVTAAVCVCSAFARQRPLAATIAACPIILLGVLLRDWSTFQTATDGLIIPVFLFAYHLGVRPPVAPSVVALVALAACCQAADNSVNPFIVIDTLGPWIVGFIARSRARASRELERQRAELAEAQTRLEAEAVRYERTRIARELHDIVAHCVTVMVVQAGAAQYLAGHDDQGTRDALDTITESARQAEVEIARLVAVLADPPDQPAALIDDLIRRTRATGLPINYHLVGDAGQLPDETLDLAYRVVREAVTNSLKHAPGATIDIALRCSRSAVRLQVINGPPQAARLELASGGHGLNGMRERIHSRGGALEAGPAADGGWRVAVDLPTGARASI